MGLLSSLTRDQKQAVMLLQAGTFLEYFDLMLYVHMAVLLNEIFFPKSDPHTASLLAALALCSSLAFRPIGALIFGWIGDHIGRKPTIIITTTMMAISCIVMANLPTYAQIGIAAAWSVTICRIFQGMSSMGEIVGAEIYLTETIERPASFTLVASIHVADILGAIAALGVAFLVVSCGMNWRFAFWLGAFIAIVTAFARKRLRETPEFLEMKRKEWQQGIQEMNLDGNPVYGAKLNATWKEPINKKTLISYFFISCGMPLGFYLAFFHFIPVLKESFSYSTEDIIKHNLLLAFIDLITGVTLVYLSYRVHPLKIQKIRSTLGLLFFILLPFLIMAVTSPVQLFLIQSLLIILKLENSPCVPVFYSHFPVYRRFTSATVLFSLSRALMYTITSFGLIYLVSYWGSFGIWVITLPIAIAYLCSLSHFEGLERKFNLYPNLSKQDWLLCRLLGCHARGNVHSLLLLAI
jgi:MHS family proline/betaine transporter-like MFS transporter